MQAWTSRIPIALLPLVLLAVGAAGDAGAQPAGRAIVAAQPPDLIALLERKKVVLVQQFDEDEPYGGYIRGLVIFEQPRHEVMQLLIQIDRQREYFPEFRKIRPVGGTETSQLIEYQIKIMLMRIRYRSRYEWDLAKSQIWWALDPGYDNDLASLDGRWELFELDDQRTLGRFALRVDIGPGLPHFLQDLAQRSKVPRTLENTRKWVDSAGSHRP